MNFFKFYLCFLAMAESLQATGHAPKVQLTSTQDRVFSYIAECDSNAFYTTYLYTLKSLNAEERIELLNRYEEETTKLIDEKRRQAGLQHVRTHGQALKKMFSPSKPVVFGLATGISGLLSVCSLVAYLVPTNVQPPPVVTHEDAISAHFEAGVLDTVKTMRRLAPIVMILAVISAYLTHHSIEEKIKLGKEIDQLNDILGYINQERNNNRRPYTWPLTA